MAAKCFPEQNKTHPWTGLDILLNCLNRYLDCAKDSFLETQHLAAWTDQPSYNYISRCYTTPLSAKYTRICQQWSVHHSMTNSYVEQRRIEWNDKKDTFLGKSPNLGAGVYQVQTEPERQRKGTKIELVNLLKFHFSCFFLHCSAVTLVGYGYPIVVE